MRDGVVDAALMVDVQARADQIHERCSEVAELSDGTLQYLLLVAALTSVEQPSLIVLNEPERSLHAELIEPLAAMIARTAGRTQVLVVTHQQQLAAALGGARIELEKEHGQTVVAGREGLLDQPSWHWPKR